MKNGMKSLKLIGCIVSIIGAGAALATDMVNSRMTDEMIKEKVDEALAEREQKDEEES